MRLIRILCDDSNHECSLIVAEGHITAEVDCERLFSEAGALSDPKRSMTKVRHYERMVIIKHRLERIYIDNNRVHKKFMERMHAKDWEEGEERDDLVFLKLEKELHKELFPNDDCPFGVLEEEEEDSEEE